MSTNVRFKAAIPDDANISAEWANGNGHISGSMVTVQGSHGYVLQSSIFSIAVSNKVFIWEI